MASKYKLRGAYHYWEFNERTPYRNHVEDLVEQVMKHGPKSLVEIGAGEGLILSRFEKRGLVCVGCDIDPHAVRLAKREGNKVHLGTVDYFAGQVFDVALLCDVLEHVEDFEGTIEAAQMLAPLVVVATPDRHDPYAVRQPTVDSIITRFKGWELLHTSQRHARWLMIFGAIKRDD